MARQFMSMKDFCIIHRCTTQEMAEACDCSIDTVKRWKRDGAQVKYDQETRTFEITLRGVVRDGRFGDV